jgi:hypothetical protein
MTADIEIEDFFFALQKLVVGPGLYIGKGRLGIEACCSLSVVVKSSSKRFSCPEIRSF